MAPRKTANSTTGRPITPDTSAGPPAPGALSSESRSINTAPPVSVTTTTTTTTTSTTNNTPIVSSTTASTTTPSATPASTKSFSNTSSPAEILQTLWDKYVNTTPQRTKLIDVFMVFLVAVGVIQFAYCVLAGNYPFNAFLSGFAATVGQFVLTASLRIQSNPANKAEFSSVSPERAFADFVFGSLILHFFCVNFIN